MRSEEVDSYRIVINGTTRNWKLLTCGLLSIIVKINMRNQRKLRTE